MFCVEVSDRIQYIHQVAIKIYSGFLLYLFLKPYQVVYVLSLSPDQYFVNAFFLNRLIAVSPMFDYIGWWTISMECGWSSLAGLYHWRQFRTPGSVCLRYNRDQMKLMKHFVSGLKRHMGHIKNFYHMTSNQIHDFECNNVITTDVS